jgi:arylsulfatase A-like enzyme
MGLRTWFLATGLALFVALQSSDVELRELTRAFRPAKHSLEVHERRLAAVRAVADDDVAPVAKALIDAYVQLEKESVKPAQRHRDAITKRQRYTATELRPELDGLRELQDELLATLLALETPGAVAHEVERALEGKKDPLALRLALARRAGELEELPGRELDKVLASRDATTLIVALTATAAIGPRAPELAERTLVALRHKDPAVREAAAAALATLSVPEGIEPLIERLEDEQARTRVRMTEALQVLTGQRIGASPVGWRRWFENEGGPFAAGEVELGRGEIVGGLTETARYHGLPLDGESVLFLMDFSKSMKKRLDDPGRRRAGAEEARPDELRIHRAKAELIEALGRLEPHQRFDIVGFDGSLDRYGDELMLATEKNVEAAKEWVQRHDLALGTNIYAALELAFELAGRGTDDSHYDTEVDTIFLLTDGRPWVAGPDDPERILSGARRWNAERRVVVHTIGLGDEVLPGFLGALARDAGGRFVIEGVDGAVDMSVRPNVLVFLVDDMGWSDPGFAGEEQFDTPNMDRLARNGMLFSSAYVNAPNCAPSRASLMTGLYTPRHGIYTVNNSDRGKSSRRQLIPTSNTTVLEERFVTLAEALRAGGYETAMFGKWHLGEDPTTQGFDRNGGGDQRGSPKKGYFPPYGMPTLPDGPEGEYLTDRLTDEAIAFLGEERDDPFFLYLSHYAVHTPIQAKEQGAGYAGMVASVDESLGRILDTLAELDLAENTLVVLTSDNGALSDKTSMAPLRGQKGTIYEAGLRVPFVVRWPGRVQAGTTMERPVIGSDLYPTVLDAAGLSAPYELDGVSLIPLLVNSGDLDPRALFWHFPAYLEPYGDSTEFRARPCAAVRKARFKLIEFFEDDRLELYNLFTDPGETENLAESYPEKRDELLEEMRMWREETGAPVPTERNTEFGEEQE